MYLSVLMKLRQKKSGHFLVYFILHVMTRHDEKSNKPTWTDYKVS